MRRFVCLLLILLTLGGLSVSAAEGNVSYQGQTGGIVFGPGGEESLTDLFPDLKGVMPGDTLTQRITVRNQASNNVKVKLYIRALGAQPGSEDFLSQLHLTVKKSQDNEMAYMFDAGAHETAQLTDWVCLGTLYSGGTVDLDVVLTVPVELDNAFADRVGYLDWQFMAEEFPVEPEDPKPPQTGDESALGWWVAAMIGSAAAMILLLWYRKRDQEDRQGR